MVHFDSKPPKKKREIVHNSNKKNLLKNVNFFCVKQYDAI